MSDNEILGIYTDAYDVVMNGQEVGGGSICIRDSVQQESVFKCLKLTNDEINETFGFFVEALKYCTPPHGGLAIGIDRLVSIILNTSSIRDVIAFPKNRVAFCPLTKAPNTVSNDQLQELAIQVQQKHHV